MHMVNVAIYKQHFAHDDGIDLMSSYKFRSLSSFGGVKDHGYLPRMESHISTLLNQFPKTLNRAVFKSEKYNREELAISAD